MKKDIISKSLIKQLIIKNISKYLIGINIDNQKYQFIDKEFERIESKRADIVIKLPTQIIHIEIQSHYDSKMAYRMLRYFLDIKELFPNLPIKQYLINLSSKKMKDYIKEFNYCYNIIDFRDLDCNKFLNSNDPDGLVLAILCDFKGKDPKEVVEIILVRLRELVGDDSRKYSDYLLMLEEISTLRNLKETVKETEVRLSEVRLEDLPSYQIGLEKGLEKGGMKKAIEVSLIAIKKFGIEPEVVAKEFGVPIEEIAKRLRDEVKQK